MYAKYKSVLYKLILLQALIRMMFTHILQNISNKTQDAVGQLPARCVVAGSCTAALMRSLGQTAPSAASEEKRWP